MNDMMQTDSDLSNAKGDNNTTSRHITLTWFVAVLVCIIFLVLGFLAAILFSVTYSCLG